MSKISIDDLLNDGEWLCEKCKAKMALINDKPIRDTNGDVSIILQFQCPNCNHLKRITKLVRKNRLNK
jgi:hypothetical protein